MSKKDEALKLALEALEEYVNVVVSVNDPNEWTPKVEDAGGPAREAITAVREALKKDVPEIGFGNMAAQQEPVPSIIQMLGYCPECGAEAHHFTKGNT